MIRGRRWPCELGPLSLLLCILLAGRLWAQEGGNVAPLTVGDKAPDFTIPLADGKSLSLKDLRGKVIYLDFFATW